MSQKSITELNINSITLSNSNYAGLTGFTSQSSTLYTSNTGVLLVNGVPISSGGAVDSIEQGDGILVTESPTGTFTIANEGVIEVTAGDGISISDSGGGSFEITNTVNTADFLTTTSAAATYQSQASMLNYSTTAQANGLYQPVGAYLTASSLDPYSTTATANTLYQPVGAYLTASSLDPYSTTAQANGLYVNKSNFTWRLADIAFPQVLNTGDSLNGQFTMVNFVGSQNNTAFIMIPGNYPNNQPPIGGNHSNFTATVGFFSTDQTNTIVDYYITNNGVATVQGLQIYCWIFAYND